MIDSDGSIVHVPTNMPIDMPIDERSSQTNVTAQYTETSALPTVDRDQLESVEVATSYAHTDVIVHSQRRFIRRVFTRWDVINNEAVNEAYEISLDDLESASLVEEDASVIVFRDGRRFIRRSFEFWDSTSQSTIVQEVELAFNDVRCVANEVVASDSSAVVVRDNNKRYIRRTVTCWSELQQQMTDEEFEIEVESLSASKTSYAEVVRNGRRFIRITIYRWDVVQNTEIPATVDIDANHYDVILYTAVHSDSSIMSSEVILQDRVFVRRLVTYWDSTQQREVRGYIYLDNNEANDTNSTTVTEHNGRRYIIRYIIRWDVVTRTFITDKIEVPDVFYNRSGNPASRYITPIIHNDKCFIRRVIYVWDESTNTTRREEVDVAVGDDTADKFTSSTVVVRDGRRYIRRTITIWCVVTLTIITRTIEYLTEGSNAIYDRIQLTRRAPARLLRSGQEYVRRVVVRWDHATQQLVRDTIHVVTPSRNGQYDESAIVSHDGRRCISWQVLYWDELTGEECFTTMDLVEEDMINDRQVAIVGSITRGGILFIRRTVYIWIITEGRIVERTILVQADTEKTEDERIIVRLGRQFIRRLALTWNAEREEEEVEEIETAIDVPVEHDANVDVDAASGSEEVDESGSDVEQKDVVDGSSGTGSRKKKNRRKKHGNKTTAAAAAVTAVAVTGVVVAKTSEPEPAVVIPEPESESEPESEVEYEEDNVAEVGLSDVEESNDEVSDVSLASEDISSDEEEGAEPKDMSPEAVAAREERRKQKKLRRKKQHRHKKHRAKKNRKAKKESEATPAANTGTGTGTGKRRRRRQRSRRPLMASEAAPTQTSESAQTPVSTQTSASVVEGTRVVSSSSPSSNTSTITKTAVVAGIAAVAADAAIVLSNKESTVTGTLGKLMI
jgi:hypothetical protein